jgi:hypothetical protein
MLRLSTGNAARPVNYCARSKTRLSSGCWRGTGTWRCLSSADLLLSLFNLWCNRFFVAFFVP